MDVVVPVLKDLRLGLGDADDEVDAYQQHGYDHESTDSKVVVHELLLYFFSPDCTFSPPTSPETALRATCNFTLSGFTRTINRSPETLTMVPTIPPVVTISLPASRLDNILACCFFCF